MGTGLQMGDQGHHKQIKEDRGQRSGVRESVRSARQAGLGKHTHLLNAHIISRRKDGVGGGKNPRKTESVSRSVVSDSLQSHGL